VFSYEQIYKIVKAINGQKEKRSQNSCHLSEKAEEEQKETKEAAA